MTAGSAGDHGGAVLVPADEAAGHLEQALLHHRRGGRPVDLARAQLAYGELLRQGLSQKDVAAQLWISPRTVAFHLPGVFGEVRICSRGALAQLPLP